MPPDHSDTTPPTVRDIARSAGVSHTTVSRALRNHPGVSEKTAAFIQTKAAEMGYRPDPMVSALLTRVQARRTDRLISIIGWINTHLDKDEWHTVPYHRGFLAGARKRAESLGFVLDEFWIHEKGMTWDRLGNVLKARGVQGLIVPFCSNPDWAGHFEWEHFCAVLIGLHQLHTWNAHRITDNDTFNLGLALEHLTRRGYKRPGLVINASCDEDSDHMLTGRFLSYQLSLPARDRVPILFLPDAILPCAAQVTKWLDRHQPDVLICNDAGAKPVLEKTKRKIPRDIGLVHVNLGPDVEGWSGIDQRHEWQGAAAVDLVSSHILRNEPGIREFAKQIYIPGTWVDGKTVRARR